MLHPAGDASVSLTQRSTFAFVYGRCTWIYEHKCIAHLNISNNIHRMSKNISDRKYAVFKVLKSASRAGPATDERLTSLRRKRNASL